MASFPILLENFKTLDDSRTDYWVDHLFLGIIGFQICAVICGAERWADIENYRFLGEYVIALGPE